jgi:spore photoproduct lyase
MILYIEQQIIDHPRTQQICNFFPNARKIVINHYKNIFDRKFPQQLYKRKDILVLAQLTGNAISQAPE